MSALILKLIACLSMLTDHIGYFKPIDSYLILRAIGRIAFPIFAWNIGNGYAHTKNKLRYFLTLLGAGVVSEIPFDLCFNDKFFYFEDFNVMFTLALGLLSIMLIDAIPTVFKFLKPNIAKTLGLIVITAPIAFLADLICTDYAAYGVILIVLLWLAGNRKPWCAVRLLFFSLRSVIQYFLQDIFSGYAFSVAFDNIVAFSKRSVTPATVLSIPLILLYNGKSGYEKISAKAKGIIKYSFYAFYPVHLTVLYFIFR